MFSIIGMGSHPVMKTLKPSPHLKRFQSTILYPPISISDQPACQFSKLPIHQPRRSSVAVRPHPQGVSNGSRRISVVSRPIRPSKKSSIFYSILFGLTFPVWNATEGPRVRFLATTGGIEPQLNTFFSIHGNRTSRWIKAESQPVRTLVLEQKNTIAGSSTFSTHPRSLNLELETRNLELFSREAFDLDSNPAGNPVNDAVFCNITRGNRGQRLIRPNLAPGTWNLKPDTFARGGVELEVELLARLP